MVKILGETTTEYRNLQLVAVMLKWESPNNCHYWVDDTYFDYGQGWKWTTILCRGVDGAVYQAINPAEWERIVFATEIDELEQIVKDILSDKYCPDRKR